MAWLWIYRRPREKPQVSAAEMAYIESDPADPIEPVSWRRLIGLRETCEGPGCDRFLAPEIEAAVAFVRDGGAVRAAESVTGHLEVP